VIPLSRNQLGASNAGNADARAAIVAPSSKESAIEDGSG
jgi:hypothetical protein